MLSLTEPEEVQLNKIVKEYFFLCHRTINTAEIHYPLQLHTVFLLPLPISSSHVILTAQPSPNPSTSISSMYSHLSSIYTWQCISFQILPPLLRYCTSTRMVLYKTVTTNQFGSASKTKVTRSDDLELVEARVFGILAKYIDILRKDWMVSVQLTYEAKKIFF